MFWTRSLSTRLHVAYIAQTIFEFDRCNPEHTHNRLFQEHPYAQMWEDIQQFYTLNGYDKLSDVEIKELFHKYGIKGIEVTIHGEPKTIPAGAVYQAKALWEKYGWAQYEANRRKRRVTARKVGVKAAIIIGSIIVSGPIGGATAWAGVNS